MIIPITTRGIMENFFSFSKIFTPSDLKPNCSIISSISFIVIFSLYLMVKDFSL